MYMLKLQLIKIKKYSCALVSRGIVSRTLSPPLADTKIRGCSSPLYEVMNLAGFKSKELRGQGSPELQDATQNRVGGMRWGQGEPGSLCINSPQPRVSS